MAPTFEIVEAKRHHCGLMARKLRREHAAALDPLDIDIHRELVSRFDASSFRRSWLIDGSVEAMGGVVGSAIAPLGYIWLVMSDLAMRYKVRVVREARRQLSEIMQTRIALVSTLLLDDDASRRFALFLGFRVEAAAGDEKAVSMIYGSI